MIPSRSHQCSHSLCVGNLHSDVTEAKLIEKFSRVGNVLSVRVCRDYFSHHSLGFAYVNFSRKADASRALAMNGDIIKGKAITVNWYMKDSEVNGVKYETSLSSEAAVIVRNFDVILNEQQLYDSFSAFGVILSCKIMRGNDDMQMAIVLFEKKESASNAINKLNGMLFCGKPISVKSYLSKRVSQLSMLYVSNLHSSISEVVLFEMFSKAGQVQSVSIYRHHKTNQSLGYGYVCFPDLKDAERALLTLNFAVVDGQPIRILRLPPGFVGDIESLDKCFVFVINLDESVTEKVLYDTFSVYGITIACHIERYEDGKSQGFGAIHYEHEEAADIAVSKCNGLQLNGKEIYVHKDSSINNSLLFKTFLKYGNIPFSNLNSGDSSKSLTNVYVKNFGDSLNNEMLRDMFAKFGTITSARSMRDENGKYRGFGFVNFQEEEAAAKAIECINGEMINGKILFVGYAQTKSERVAELNQQLGRLNLEKRNRNLYVKNLSLTTTEKRLRDEFSLFGMITSTKIMTNSSGVSKGFGFVSFSSIEEAERARLKMNGKKIESNIIYVSVAQSKEERKSTLAKSKLNKMIELMQRKQNEIKAQNGVSPYIPLVPQMVPVPWIPMVQSVSQWTGGEPPSSTAVPNGSGHPSTILPSNHLPFGQVSPLVAIPRINSQQMQFVTVPHGSSQPLPMVAGPQWPTMQPSPMLAVPYGCGQLISLPYGPAQTFRIANGTAEATTYSSHDEKNPH